MVLSGLENCLFSVSINVGTIKLAELYDNFHVV